MDTPFCVAGLEALLGLESYFDKDLYGLDRSGTCLGTILAEFGIGIAENRPVSRNVRKNR